jgi:hypothetical protein
MASLASYTMKWILNSLSIPKYLSSRRISKKGSKNCPISPGLTGKQVSSELSTFLKRDLRTLHFMVLMTLCGPGKGLRVLRKKSIPLVIKSTILNTENPAQQTCGTIRATP